MTQIPDRTLDVPIPWRIDGRVALVTGAAGGIGRAAVDALAAAGATVVCADLSLDSANETAQSAREGRAFVEAVALDVTDRRRVESVVSDVVKRHGTLDIVCNLAGIAGESKKVADLDEASFDQMFAVHFKGTLFVCQAALGPMVAAGRGSIINMSSAAIDLAPATIASYAVSKASVSMLTRVLANEVGPHGVRVNALAPSFIPTELSMQRYEDEESRQDYLKWWAAKAPMGRVGQPQDIAAQVLYLATDAAGFVTGQTLRANGGITMPW